MYQVLKSYIYFLYVTSNWRIPKSIELTTRFGVVRIDNNFYVYSCNGLLESYPFTDDMYDSILEELHEERLKKENVIDEN